MRMTCDGPCVRRVLKRVAVQRIGTHCIVTAPRLLESGGASMLLPSCWNGVGTQATSDRHLQGDSAAMRIVAREPRTQVLFLASTLCSFPLCAWNSLCLASIVERSPQPKAHCGSALQDVIFAAHCIQGPAHVLAAVERRQEDLRDLSLVTHTVGDVPVGARDQSGPVTGQLVLRVGAKVLTQHAGATLCSFQRCAARPRTPALLPASLMT